jgi:RNA polymerase sigma-70 factor (ECF subfamily)
MPEDEHHHRDQALVRRLMDGDEAAFEQLSEQCLGGLWRFALTRVGHDEQLAREMFQSTLATAFETLAAYRGESTLLSWLCGICRFKVGSHYRTRRRRPREVDLDAGDGLEAVLGTLTSSGGDPEERLRRREMTTLVHLALDRLPERYGRALEWKYLEGLPVGEIADRLQVGLKAAESILSRARPAFRAAFQKLHRDVEGGYRGLRLVTERRSG